MDRGRDRVGGPDDVGAATDDDRVEPAPTPDDGSPTAESPATDDGVRAAGVAADDDARPAVWLADIRARAPWLLGPDGAPRWRATGPSGPAHVPHGMTPTEPRLGATERVDRTKTPGTEPASPSIVPGGRAARSSIENTAGDAGPPAGAGGPGASEAGPPSSDTDPRPLHPAELTDPAIHASEPSTRAASPWTVEPDADPGTPDRSFGGLPGQPWLDLENPGAHARHDPITSDAADVEADAEGPPRHDPWPDPDPRRPAIHRSSATWSPAPARRAASSPAWPPRPRPDAAGLPHPGSIPEPSRPMPRPVTPFVPDHPGPASPTNRPPGPTWAEDRSGWHALAVPPARIVDETALPPWPSLLDEDDDDGEEPDWAALERSYERMLRLDREQRRR